MVKAKGLGRKLKVKPGCYAAEIVGGCSKSLSQEHPLSENLRRDKTFSQRIRMKHAFAPVLCVTHNGVLSKTDAEAGRLSAALREVGARSHSLIVRPYEVVHIDARLFGRWLCKFYCGYVKMTGQEPHRAFIRYAFGMETQEPIRFLFPVWLGGKPPLGDTRNMPLRIFRTVPGGPEAFHVTFEGLDVVVGTLPGNAPEMVEIFAPFPEGTQVIERLRLIDFPEDQFRIRLDWSGDPDEARILDPSGMPAASRSGG